MSDSFKVMVIMQKGGSQVIMTINF